tara:strand:+ start:103 stop:366 length:264 start_codon:yes stop_codon:yes gene_type:complete
MDIKNQQGDHVAKTKRTKKSLEEGIKNIEINLSNVYMETQKLNTFMIGLENLVMYLAEHLDKKESFEKFIKGKLEEHKKELDKDEEK